MSPRRTWGVKPFPLTLPDDDPRLTPTHTINTPEREAFRQRIVDEHLAGTSPVEGRAPVLYLMGGGGASGKGHVKDLLIRRGEIPGHGAVELDPDEIKGKIPEYAAIVDARDSRAASVVHQESSDVSKRVLGEAMNQRRDIVYDVTLGNPEKGRALIDRAKAAGYDVRLYGVTVDAAMAVQRNGERAERTGRYVPVEEQLKAHKGFSEGFESYAARADRAKLYDTNGPGAKVIAAKTPSGQLVTRPEEYAAFQKKATIDPSAQGPDDLYPAVQEATNQEATSDEAADQERRAEYHTTEQERAEQERTEQERSQQGSVEQQRAEHDNAEHDRAQYESAEQDRAQQDAAEQDRAQHDNVEQDRAQHESAEQDRAQQDAAEQDAAQQDAAEKATADQASAEQDAAHQESAAQESAEQSAAEQSAAEHAPAESAPAEQESAPASDYEGQASADDDRVAASMGSAESDGYGGDSYGSEPSQDMGRDDR